MAQSAKRPAQRRVLFGYAPDEVAADVRRLQEQVDEARAKAATEAARAAAADERVAALEREVEELERRVGSPTYERLAERLREMIDTAHRAAEELRAGAREEAAERGRHAEERVATVLEEAHREAERVRAGARQVADGMIQEAERRVAELHGEVASAQEQRARLLGELEALRSRVAAVAADDAEPG